jgi:hypothetical protein
MMIAKEIATDIAIKVAEIKRDKKEQKGFSYK